MFGNGSCAPACCGFVCGRVRGTGHVCESESMLSQRVVSVLMNPFVCSPKSKSLER